LGEVVGGRRNCCRGLLGDDVELADRRQRTLGQVPARSAGPERRWAGF